MATKTVQQFINTYSGKAIDYDGVAGVQCVDAFKLFCSWAGYPVKATGNGWASGYWLNRNSSGYSKYFDFITDKKKLQTGDWLFWNNGSKSSPYSHVGMFIEYADSAKTKAKIFGQNQGSNGQFRTITMNLDILGAFRPKMWAKTTQQATNITKTVKATGIATKYNAKLAKTYKTTANLNLRNSANGKILTTMKKGQEVTCYGYYTPSGNIKWLYVQALIGKVLYTGFCSNQYLK